MVLLSNKNTQDKKLLNCQLITNTCNAIYRLPYMLVYYSLIIHIIAKITKLKPNILAIIINDVNIKKDDTNKITYLNFKPHGFPYIKFSDKINLLCEQGNLAIRDFTETDINLVNYFPQN